MIEMLRSYARFLRAVANSLLNSSDILEESSKQNVTDEEIAHTTAQLLDAKDEMLMHLCNLDFSHENTLAVINWIAHPAQSPRPLITRFGRYLPEYEEMIERVRVVNQELIRLRSKG